MIPERPVEHTPLTEGDIALIHAAMYVGGLEDAERSIAAQRAQYEAVLLSTYGPQFVEEVRAFLTRARFVSRLEGQFGGAAETDRPPDGR